MNENLKAEMARNHIKTKDLAEAIGKDIRTITNRLSGKSDFSIPEARIIRDTFFPDLDIEYLFIDNNKPEEGQLETNKAG